MENDDIEVIQINIHGEDKPGLTSSLTDILARYDAAILDIGQANIHQTLSMGILFKTDSIRSGDIMKDLLFKAYELGIQIRFQPITVEQYEQWVGMQGKNRYIITMLGRKLTAQQIAAVTRVVAEQGLNIDSILRLTGRVSLDENARAPKSLAGADPDRIVCALRSAGDIPGRSSHGGRLVLFRRDISRVYLFRYTFLETRLAMKRTGLLCMACPVSFASGDRVPLRVA